MAKNYKELDNAVKDFLCELRIDGKCLEIMAKGYSPDYPGAINANDRLNWENPHCKIQLSKVVAGKLLNTMDI